MQIAKEYTQQVMRRKVANIHFWSAENLLSSLREISYYVWDSVPLSLTQNDNLLHRNLAKTLKNKILKESTNKKKAHLRIIKIIVDIE